MSYEKEGVTMRAVWPVPNELEEYPLDHQVASGDPEHEDAPVQEDQPIARHPALAAMDDDDLWEIPTRLAP